MNKEGIKIDGIPIEDYNGFTSKTLYNDKICISETPIIEPGIFLDGVKITTAEEWNKAIEEFRKRENEFIPKQKIRDKIKEIEIQYAEWDAYEDSVKLEVLKELLEEGE